MNISSISAWALSNNTCVYEKNIAFAFLLNNNTTAIF